MGGARSFRELKVYQAAREAAGRIFAMTKSFPREERYETQSWLDDARDDEYLSKEDFEELDDRYQAIGGMLSRMIDRADDFCKHAPATDYRSVLRVEEESLFTDH